MNIDEHLERMLRKEEVLGRNRPAPAQHPKVAEDAQRKGRIHIKEHEAPHWGGKK